MVRIEVSTEIKRPVAEVFKYVIDPAKVTRLALQNAASIAGLMLTTEALVADIREEEKKAVGAGPHGGGMGGGGMY